MSAWRTPLPGFALCIVAALALPAQAQGQPFPPEAPTPWSASTAAPEAPASQTAGVPRVDLSDPVAAILASPLQRIYDELSQSYALLTQEYVEVLREYMMAAAKARIEESDKNKDKVIFEVQELEAKKRDETSVELAKFIKKYSSFKHDKQYRETLADALFRLAELYRETADYKDELDTRYAKQRQEEYELGIRASPPSESAPNYQAAIDLYYEVVRDYTEYRYRDLVMYLLGYFVRESDDDGRFEESRYLRSNKVLVDLVNSYPDSEYQVHAWYLIGSNYYDEALDTGVAADFDPAIRAFETVAGLAEGKNPGLYQEALYRQGWSNYQAFKYPESIRAFMRLLDFSEQGALEGEKVGSVREEAIQAVSDSFLDLDWNGDNQPDPDAGPQRAFQYLDMTKLYVKDVLRDYANALYDHMDVMHFIQASEVYTKYVDKYALERDAPVMHSRLITCYDELAKNPGGKLAETERMRFFELAMAERAKLAQLYGVGSEWARRHQMDAKATRLVAGILGDNLRRRATELHGAARKLKASAGVEAARSLYVQAIGAYRDFLAQFPLHPARLEIQLLIAECYRFGTMQYTLAAEEYEKLRDARERPNPFETEAAQKGVASRELALLEVEALNDPNRPIPKNLITADAAADTIGKILPSADNDPTKPNTVEPVAIPEVVAAWMKSAQEVATRGYGGDAERKKRGRFLFRIGKAYYRYGHFEQARLYYERVLKEYGDDTDLATFAYVELARSYKIMNDLDGMEVIAQRMRSEGKGDPSDIEATLKSVLAARLDSRYMRQSKLYEQALEAEKAKDEKRARELFSAVAGELETLVDENPDFKQADEALLTAAQSFDRVKLYEKGAKLYGRLVTEPRFRDSKHRETALRAQANNFELFFDVENAVRSYLQYTEEYDDSEFVKEYMGRAVRLLENNQEYTRAAKYAQEYAQRYRTDQDVAKALYLVGSLFEKAKDTGAAQAAYNRFLDKFWDVKKEYVRVMSAYMKLGRWAEQGGDVDEARKYYKKVQTTFQRASVDAQDEAAEVRTAADLMAEASFRLVELRVPEFSRLPASGKTVKEFQKASEKRLAKLAELSDAFNAVIDVATEYRVPTWAVASLCRLGILNWEWAEAVRGVAVPDDLANDEEASVAFEEYRDGRFMARKDAAIESWRLAAEISRKWRLVGEWPLRTLEELNRFDAERANYPLYRELKQFRADSSALDTPGLD